MESKSERRRRTIIESAVKLFDERGYANTSLDDVAQAVGLKREALYYYFKNRTEILLAIIEPQTKELYEGLKAVTKMDTTPTIKLQLAIKNHLVRFDRHCLEMTISLRDGVLSPDDPVREFMTTLWKKYERMWTKLILDGQRAGEFDSTGNPKMIAFGILGMCNWIARWYDPTKKVSINQIIDTYTSLVCSGIVQKAP